MSPSSSNLDPSLSLLFNIPHHRPPHHADCYFFHRYATAKDEFEIASEETEKKTVYAADDRAAASEELGKLKHLFSEAVNGEGGGEIQRRVGQRIRELDRAVEAMEERAKED